MNSNTLHQADIGLIGLAVMGENLVLNIERNGFTVAVYNRSPSRVAEFISGRASGKNIIGTQSLEELCSVLKRPRRIMLMIRAGEAVDQVIALLLNHLEPGDIVIDGGNSDYHDTARRTKELAQSGISFIGAGVSGGEEGALTGPSIMPGGNPVAWPDVKPIFQAIAAKTDDGTPCSDWVGPDGAGHFVKMIHNGIEYGDMQLICETYQMMKAGLRMSNDEMSAVFRRWNEGLLDSYLIEVTRDVLAYRDTSGNATLDEIVDAAGQKGTGRLTVASALNAGQPLTLISEAVFARCLSALRDERISASEVFTGPEQNYSGDTDELLNDLEQALYASKIVSYAQGFALMRAVSAQNEWNLDLGSIAMLWRAGCIVRSVFLENIRNAYEQDAGLINLLLDPFFAAAVENAQQSWRRVVAAAAVLGIPMPATSAALAYFDSYRCARLPANLLQAQRDFFGAHGYERCDAPRGEFFHTDWTGRGGATASTSYDA